MKTRRSGFAGAAGGLGLALMAVGAAGAQPAVQTRSVAYDGVKVTWLQQGSGPAVVMIPSLGRGAADFDDLARRVAAAGFEVLRIQPRGIDGSAGPMTGITLRNLADDVAHVIEASGARRAVVLGHDDGNRVARATAAYFPDRVSAVILVGSGGKVPPDPQARAALRATFDTTLSHEAHLKDVATAFFAPGHDPAVWDGGWYPATAGMEGVAGGATPTSEWWTAGSSAPILVVQGLQDRIAPPANADALKRDVGGRAQVVFIDGAGHALLPEAPDRLATAVVGFLEAQEKAGR
jgi:pimeloyl-ACP methyl ester carboxylesterase